MNLIKKNSAFMEQVLAAKALREGERESEETIIPEKEEPIQREDRFFNKLDESIDRESIISAAEEAAFAEQEL